MFGSCVHIPWNDSGESLNVGMEDLATMQGKQLDHDRSAFWQPHPVLKHNLAAFNVPFECHGGNHSRCALNCTSGLPRTAFDLPYGRYGAWRNALRRYPRFANPWQIAKRKSRLSAVTYRIVPPIRLKLLL